MSETRGLLLLYTVHGPIHYYWSTDCIGSLNVNVCRPTCLLRTVVPNGKNSPKIDSLQFAWCDFTNFFKPTFTISVSGDCSPFIFKICQTVAVNFTVFFQLNFWRDFCYLAQLYYAARFRAFQRFTAWFLPAFGPLLFDEFYCYSVLRRCHLPYKLCCQTDSASQLGFAGLFGPLLFDEFYCSYC